MVSCGGCVAPDAGAAPGARPNQRRPSARVGSVVELVVNEVWRDGGGRCVVDVVVDPREPPTCRPHESPRTQKILERQRAQR